MTPQEAEKRVHESIEQCSASSCIHEAPPCNSCHGFWVEAAHKNARDLRKACAEAALTYNKVKPALHKVPYYREARRDAAAAILHDEERISKEGE